MSRASRFFELYPSINTQKTYRQALNNFFQSTYPTATQTLDELSDQYFAEERNYEADLQGFLLALNGRPPKTRLLKRFY